MAHFTTTLRDIIYHYTQDLDPYAIAAKEAAETGRYPFILPSQDISVTERITAAMDSIIDPSIQFYDDDMKKDFWMQFCTKNIMREIEYEEPAMWILQFNHNVRRCIWRYNKFYEMMKTEIDLTNSHKRQMLRNADGTHERETEDKGTSTASTQNKSVFEDTPESSLGNNDYATNITTSTGNANTETQGNGTENSSYADKETVIETGFDGPQGEIIRRNMDSLIDVIGRMVDECSQRIFLKLFMYN